jgi:transposase
MHWLQHSALKSARAWRLKMALREVYQRARIHDRVELAARELQGWLSWARRCSLEPFKKLAATITGHLPGVVRGMVDERSNAYVEAMNAQLQLAKRAARGYRTATNFIPIAYLRLAKLTHLPASPFAAAGAK